MISRRSYGKDNIYCIAYVCRTRITIYVSVDILELLTTDMDSDGDIDAAPASGDASADGTAITVGMQIWSYLNIKND